MSNAITRREALAMGGALAGAAALAPLTGCAPANQGWDGSTYLPIGSVVKLKAFASADVKHMVLTRRPKLSATYAVDANGTVATNEVQDVYDYALLVWPVGFVNDITNGATMTDVTYANTSDISEVLFMGLQDDIEKSAQASLDSCRSNNTDGIEAMHKILNESLEGKVG